MTSLGGSETENAAVGLVAGYRLASRRRWLVALAISWIVLRHLRDNRTVFF